MAWISRVTDAQQSGLPPALQPVHADTQQLDRVPARQLLLQPPGEQRHQGADFSAKGIESARLDGADAALVDHISALPVAAPVDHRDEAPGTQAPAAARRVPLALADPQPEHIDRRAEVTHRQASRFAQHRAPAVGADHQVGLDAQLSLRRSRDDAGDKPPGLHQPGRFGVHHQVETGVGAGVSAQEVQELPLRHHCDKSVMGLQPPEIGDQDLLLAHCDPDLIGPAACRPARLRRCNNGSKRMHSPDQGNGPTARPQAVSDRPPPDRACAHRRRRHCRRWRHWQESCRSAPARNCRQGRPRCGRPHACPGCARPCPMCPCR